MAQDNENQGESYAKKESIVKKLNERITSIVRHAGTDNEEYIRWVTKLTRSGSPYPTRTATYNPGNIKLARNRGANQERTSFIVLSRSRSDIESMNLEDLERLESQTRGWGAVKREARRALEEQRRNAQENNPFEEEEAETAGPITDEDITAYLQQKEKVRQFIEGNTEAFYALIEATGWDDIRDHTTEEIYNEIQKIDMGTYAFNSTLTEVGQSYIQRRDASRERRRALGI